MFWLLAVRLHPLINNLKILKHQTRLQFFDAMLSSSVFLTFFSHHSPRLFIPNPSLTSLCVSTPAEWAAGRSDPPNAQPRLTLMHHSLTGTEERETRKMRGVLSNLLQQCAVQ